MGYWRKGPRLPDEYTKDWDYPDISNERAFWMMGHESGYHQCEWDNGIGPPFREDGAERGNELKRLQQENEAYRALIGTNYRIMKEEIRKELSEEKKEQVRGEAVQTANPM